MNNTPKLLLAALIGTALALPAPAMALTQWQRTHPARTRINARIAHQQRRITREVHEGDLTHQQAHALRAQDHAVRHQERAYARADGNHGHLTPAQVKALNGELNANSRAIGR